MLLDAVLSSEDENDRWATDAHDSKSIVLDHRQTAWDSDDISDDEDEDKDNYYRSASGHNNDDEDDYEAP